MSAFLLGFGYSIYISFAYPSPLLSREYIFLRNDALDANILLHHALRSFSLEMSKVNNTLKAFVGGKQKPWMLNGGAIQAPGGIPVQTTIRSQTNPIKRKTMPLNKQRPTGDSARNSVTITTMGPEKSPPSTAPSSLSPDLRGSGLSLKRRVPAGNTETVLPSPTPSDTPSVADQREDEGEVATLAAIAGDNEDDQRYGDRQDERGAAVDTRGNQTELSSGSVDATKAGSEGQQHVSTKRGLDTVDERPETPKRQRQSSPLPPSDQTDVETSLTQIRVPGPGKQGSGAGLSNRAQSPVVIDSRQTSPTYHPNVQCPPKLQNQTPSNVPPVAGHNHAFVGPSSGGNNPLPLLYSTSLPLTTSSPLAQSPMLVNTSPSYGSSGTAFPGLPPDQNTWLPQGIPPPYHALPSPGVLQTQQQQQLQEQAQQTPGGPSVSQPLPGPEYLTKLTTHLPRFDQFIHTEGGTDLRQFNSVECFRFRILREAITKDDWFFTVLNQVYALMSTAEETLNRETGISGNLPGFGALPDILHDNQRLSGRNLQYLASFPMSLTEAKLRLPFFPALLRQVGEFLSSGYKVCTLFPPIYANLLISQLTTPGHSDYEALLF